MKKVYIFICVGVALMGSSLWIYSSKFSLRANNLMYRCISKIIDRNERKLLEKSLYIIAMPKSASTFIANTLRSLTNRSGVNFYEGNHQEQNFDRAKIQDFWMRSEEDRRNCRTIGQAHMRATQSNLALIKSSGMKVILLTRKLPDVVISLHDHLLAVGNGGFLLDLPKEKFVSMSKTERLDFIVDHFIPWYINFYFGWMQALEQDPELRRQVFHLRYEDFVSGRVEKLSEVLHFLSLDFDEKQLEELIERKHKQKGLRINKGISGRGARELTPSQVQKIENLIQPICDFPYVNKEDLL